METIDRHFCLDMMKVSWIGADGLEKSDCGIILEIDPVGGLVQTTVSIPQCSEIRLDTPRGVVHGRVTSCQEDNYGYIVNLAVNERAGNWFPEYVPPYLHSASGR